MKIVVIGGTGLIGSKVVERLTGHGHEAVAASPNTGVDTITGEGLADAVKGAQVVVDVSNSPSFAADAVLEFFETSTANLLAAEKAAGVGHHVALSIVGLERMPGNGYFRAKLAQEQLIKAAAMPYSIVRATQFFEFVKSITDAATDGDTIRVGPALIQPIAADDVAAVVARTAVGAPSNGTIDVAGPDRFSFAELIRRSLDAGNDPRGIVVEPTARYFGSVVEERSLVPDGDAFLAETRFEDWLNRPAAKR